ncbi:MAG: hypothetical protein FI718_05225 [SAR202 cluster bacterium]|nr:hypothetical protein [SAR202 cluster bacterium]|tara:strand:+ start:621 stop:2840 length:2220 start_codon:yes stop_codon:yes gene_type:complete
MNIEQDFLSSLNKNQREAVEHTNGPVLVVAGPGSGKTRVITSRIANLIINNNVHPYQIAALTFTNKAAKEMKQRIEEIIPNPDNSMFVGTFHSFCALALRRDGDKIGLDRRFVIYDDTDQIACMKMIMEELNIDPDRYPPRAILSTISKSKSKLIDAEGFKISKTNYFEEIVHRIYEKYQAQLINTPAVDFDDLLMLTVKLFNTRKDIKETYQERFKQVLVDEFQDTNTSQYEIAKTLTATHQNICVVGDPDQSIYSWRNADIRNILSFQSDFPKAKIIALEENYRSTKTILNAAQSIITQNKNRVEKDLWTNNNKGTRVSIYEAYNDKEEAMFVIQQIRNIIANYPLTLGDCAVMYRVNAQSRSLEEICLQTETPYQIVGTLKFYQRQEIKDTIAYLRVSINKSDNVSLMRIINNPPRGIGTKTIDHLLWVSKNRESSLYQTISEVIQSETNNTGLNQRAIKALTTFKNMVDQIADNIQNKSLIDFIKFVLSFSGYQKHIVNKPDRGQERWENIQEFMNIANEFQEQNPEQGIGEFLESISLMTDTDNLSDEEEKLTLITLHQSKGLEFPVVFMIGMEEGLLPHSRSMEDEQEMEEERRLCYVGMTRAKQILYLVRAFKRGFGNNFGPTIPSRFLSEIPDHLIRYPFEDSRNLNLPVFDVESNTNTRNNHDISNTKLQETTSKSLDIDKGDKIIHEAFGEGLVMEIKPTSNDVELTIVFKDGAGVKRFLGSIAPIKKQ